MEPEPRALLLDEMSDFLVAGPRLAARLVVARSSRKTRCDGWGAMVENDERPEERTPALHRRSHSLQPLRLPSVPSHYTAFAFSRPVCAPASPMTLRGGLLWDGSERAALIVCACLFADTLAGVEA